jgi:synaptic vesicle membrane protein VAT-1 homolog
MKKVLKHSALVLTALALVACGNSKKASDNGTASNSNFEVSVKDGMYVLPKDEDSNSHYLALQVEIKNNRDKQFSFTSHDITLYNEKDEKVEPIQIYESDSKTKFMSYGDSISKGKSVAGYVVYEVDKDAKYELHFAPSFYDDVKENQKGKNDVAIKVDPTQYEDTIDEAKEAMKKYVDAVYLDGENTGGASNVSFTNDKTQIVALEDKKSDNKKSDDKKSDDKKSEEKKDDNKSEDKKSDDKKSSNDSDVITNDVKADREEFIKKFIESFGKGFYNYKPSDSELRTFAEAYIKANAKRAKVDYKVKTYLPDYAVVYVRPETIDLDNLNVYELSRKFYDENKGKYSSYSEAMKAGEKYILENAPSQFDSTPLDTSDNMQKEGYEIKMTKKDGKWTIDTSSKNYNLKDMARTFRGGIGY